MDATGGGDNLDSGDTPKRNTTSSRVSRISRQFWQAGEFLPELDQTPNPRSDKAGLDHARLHPRFLHSNATSHKWALGALVELLDNSMDEVSAGCNYVNVDKMDHPEDGAKNPVLLVEDNGGGMDDTTIRNCMSFGFSLKHGKKMIGQYGNGFKTSTMRLGADALVLTKSVTAQTCSIGLLSYTFLTETNSQDVVVPIIDYNLQDRSRLTRGDEVEWKSKMDIICEWGPFSSEAEIWSQLDSMPIQGTRVYIWNLWQTSDDILELDFDTDSQDIRLRGSDEETQDASNRKKRADEGIKRCHAYKHSLRAYVSLLYLEWPEGFQVTLRGKEIQPIPVTEGMKHVVMYDYRPRSLPKEDANSNELKGPVSVPVYIGFAIEAPETSVSGFCVYHRNRLIKPFWKVYASASSVGRGVIGFLQVDFVEPAHDKQDFENTPPLQKLEKYLKRQVPLYWRSKARLVGYQDHIPSRNEGSATQENSPNSKSAKKPATSAQPASGSLAKTEDPPDSPLGADTVPSGTNESFSERQKTRSGKTLSTGAKHSADQTTVKTDNVQKTVQKCFHEMQHQVSQLQQTVQDFCNKYDIKEDAQMVLGRIFGTTMSKVLDPAREMKRLHSSHLKTHRNVLQFIAENHANSQLKSTIPEFILTEMQEAGIQVQDPNKEDSKNGDKMEIVASEEAIKLVETNDSKEVVTRTPKRKAAPELDTEANQIETIHSASAQMTIDVTAPAVITPEEVIPLQRSFDSHSLRKEGEPPPTRKQKTEQSNQELARLGLSVMEKYLKTKPNKMEIVQIQPGGSDVQSMEVMRIEDVEGKTTVEETIDCCTPDKLQSTEEQDAPSSDKEKQEDASIEPTS